MKTALIKLSHRVFKCQENVYHPTTDEAIQKRAETSPINGKKYLDDLE